LRRSDRMLVYSIEADFSFLSPLLVPPETQSRILPFPTIPSSLTPGRFLGKHGICARGFLPVSLLLNRELSYNYLSGPPAYKRLSASLIEPPDASPGIPSSFRSTRVFVYIPPGRKKRIFETTLKARGLPLTAKSSLFYSRNVARLVRCCLRISPCCKHVNSLFFPSGNARPSFSTRLATSSPVFFYFILLAQESAANTFQRSP